MHEDGCDSCKQVRELYHFDAEVEGNPYDGAALCDECNTAAVDWDESHGEDDEAEGTFHAELRQIIGVIDSASELAAYSADAEERDAEENGEENHIVLAIRAIQGSDLGDLRVRAEELLALPEESVAALVAAAQSMTQAASYAVVGADKATESENLGGGEPTRDELGI